MERYVFPQFGVSARCYYRHGCFALFAQRTRGFETTGIISAGMGSTQHSYRRGKTVFFTTEEISRNNASISYEEARTRLDLVLMQCDEARERLKLAKIHCRNAEIEIQKQ